MTYRADSNDVMIIIPAWNEAETIENVVRSVSPYGLVVVANDASTDQTGELAEGAGAIVVTHEKNLGYDGALNSGFKKAVERGGEYLITFDADGQHEPDNLPDMIQNLKKGVDLIIGVRPERARISEKVMAMFIWWKYGVRDPLCGLKGYRVGLYKDAGCFDSCKSIGTQLTLYACRKKDAYRIEQFPVHIHDRQDQPRLGCSLKANWRIFSALFRVMSTRG